MFSSVVFEDSDKDLILENLLKAEIPEEFDIRKPNVGPNSWILLKVAGVKKEDVENWKSQENSSNLMT